MAKMVEMVRMIMKVDVDVDGFGLGFIEDVAMGKMQLEEMAQVVLM